jgi:hypothetical protein
MNEELKWIEENFAATYANGAFPKASNGNLITALKEAYLAGFAEGARLSAWRVFADVHGEKKEPTE